MKGSPALPSNSPPPKYPAPRHSAMPLVTISTEFKDVEAQMKRSRLEAAGYLAPEHHRYLRGVERLMKDEEHHIDFLETQLDLIGRIGLDLYTQKHVGGLESEH